MGDNTDLNSQEEESHTSDTKLSMDCSSPQYGPAERVSLAVSQSLILNTTKSNDIISIHINRTQFLVVKELKKKTETENTYDIV